MNNESLANLSCELRKSKNMTQRQLAEKLNIIYKAVSKWKRGLGYPDISILAPLANILGITVNELLNGERSVAQPVEANVIVETTLQYVNKVTLNKRKSVKFTAKIVITISCLLGIFICMIIDMAISRTFTWSLYPITAIPFTWLIIIPLVHFEKNKMCISLIALSVFIIPFLFILNKVIVDTKFMLMIGIHISLIATTYMWVIYFLFSIKRAAKWNMASISTLFGIPVTLLINCIVAKLINQPLIDVWDILLCGILGVLSLVLFFIGKKQKVRTTKS